MKNKKILLLLTLLSVGSLSCQGANLHSLDNSENDSNNVSPTQTHRLVNASATTEAQKVYSVLSQLSGSKTVSGTVANVDWNIREAENVKNWTGHWPALNMFDFINLPSSKDVNSKGWIDYSDLSVAVNWWRAGGLVGAMWHWQLQANNGKDYTCTPGTQATETDFDPSCIDNPQSDGYKQLTKDLDQVATYLKGLQKKNVPVIWRPLHEASGNTYEYEGGKAWFWWGIKGSDIYKKLWRWMYDRLVNYHKLNNLIWVWCSQMNDDDWYPGDDVVDVVARDSYYALQYPLMKEYKALTAKYPSKLVALAECGNGDEVKMSSWSDIWSEGSRWCWFMPWYDYDYNDGKADTHRYADKQWWTEAFGTGLVVDRDQMKALLAK